MQIENTFMYRTIEAKPTASKMNAFSLFTFSLLIIKSIVIVVFSEIHKWT